MSNSIFGQSILPQKDKFFVPRESAVGQLQQPRDKLFLRTPELRLNVRDIDPKTKNISIKKLKPVPTKLVNVFTGETERRILSDVYPDGFPKNLALRQQNLQLAYETEAKALFPILKAEVPENIEDDIKLDGLASPVSIMSILNPSAYNILSPSLSKNSEEEEKEEEEEEEEEDSTKKEEEKKPENEVLKKIDEAFAGLPFDAASIPYATDDETKNLYQKQLKLWSSYKFYSEFIKLSKELQVANLMRFEAFEAPTVSKKKPADIWRKINFIHQSIKNEYVFKAKEYNEMLKKGDDYFKNTFAPGKKIDIDI